MKSSRFCIVFLFSIFYFLFSDSANAAILYLEPAQGEYRQGDTFIVSIRLDPGQECVNAIQADLRFPQNYLEVKDVSRGNSIVSFWVKEPEFSNQTGLISFAGGIPGGFCGLLPGDPGESNLLGRLILQAKEIGGDPMSAKIEFLGSSQALLNDGRGTPARLTTKGAVFNIGEVQPPGEVKPLRDEWQEELEKDKIPPEPFEIKINQEPAAFEGKYFIVFQTQDKQTGIDHYEVKEGRKDWERTGSPYLLDNQEINYIIKVRAVDKAGNERIAEYKPFQPSYYLITFLILTGLWVIWRVIGKFKIKK